MRIFKFKKIDSTQKKAIEMIKTQKAKPWTVIFAETQKKGIGRKGNFWYSPKGGLYFSIILPPTKIEDVEILTNLAAFWISKVIFEKFHCKPLIKFPNDVYLNGKKVAGILTQNLIFGKKIFSVIGIGINTNIEHFPDDLKEKATSFFLEFGKKINNENFLKEILKEIYKGLRKINV
ncbi:biotin--[acetyl-CoA-carboxylase] ligase [Candidatus Parcubacteria bacterium]|nr:biotin--[acetyl-CoA-carboxylase] ligase [Candidatus Parcubacteria bacterium]